MKKEKKLNQTSSSISSSKPPTEMQSPTCIHDPCRTHDVNMSPGGLSNDSWKDRGKLIS
uniref:Uncharacterized protein n=3 Tax=Oryza TaxID=4527 RepID=A0A1V1H0Z5_ORYSJ|nr:hypothetical protein [Oryza rufipogon]BAX24578.1 hypothetical protein [Oryza sativa Japonica Group]BAX24647.1 hypothetical protein [Oryza sativa Indica Group]BAX24731.1 hypothetical protein [Oryza rufipogon]